MKRWQLVVERKKITKNNLKVIFGRSKREWDVKQGKVVRMIHRLPNSERFETQMAVRPEHSY